ncbi:hypothetical protein OC834_001148 [Tilletia horrida]|nr:hypothetical protein OC834_001148 [Tilletia horrida]
MRSKFIYVWCSLTCLPFSTASPVPSSTADATNQLNHVVVASPALHSRDMMDLIISAGGAIASLGYLGVTGQYYAKTYGRRDSGGAEQDRTGVYLKTIQRRSDIDLGKRTDYYPIYIGTMAVILSAGGLTANSIAHMKLKESALADAAAHKSSKRDGAYGDGGSTILAPLHERGAGKTQVFTNSVALAKGLELMAASVSMLAMPLTFGNIMAIGRKPPPK